MILTYNSTYDISEYIKVMLNLVTLGDEKNTFQFNSNNLKDYVSIKFYRSKNLHNK